MVVGNVSERVEVRWMLDRWRDEIELGSAWYSCGDVARAVGGYTSRESLDCRGLKSWKRTLVDQRPLLRFFHRSDRTVYHVPLPRNPSLQEAAPPACWTALRNHSFLSSSPFIASRAVLRCSSPPLRSGALWSPCSHDDEPAEKEEDRLHHDHSGDRQANDSGRSQQRLLTRRGHRKEPVRKRWSVTRSLFVDVAENARKKLNNLVRGFCRISTAMVISCHPRGGHGESVERSVEREGKERWEKKRSAFSSRGRPLRRSLPAYAAPP